MPEEWPVLYRRDCEININLYPPTSFWIMKWSKNLFPSVMIISKLYVGAQLWNFCFAIFISPLSCFFFFFFSEVKCPGLLSLLFCKYLKPALSLKGVITVSPHSFNPCPHAALSLVLAQVFVWPYGASNDGTDSIYYYCF